MFVDDELHVPVRVDYSGWSRLASQPPPLLAEYTYTDLKLNVGLVDGDFVPSMLRSNASRICDALRHGVQSGSTISMRLPNGSRNSNRRSRELARRSRS